MQQPPRGLLPPMFHHQVHETAVAAELLRLTVTSSNPVLLIPPALLLLAAGWQHIPVATGAAWFAGVVAAVVFGLWFNTRYRGIDPATTSLPQLRRAEWFSVLYSAMNGVVWGLLGLLMAPGEDVHNAVVVIMFLGTCAAAAATTISSFARLLIPLLLSLALFISSLPEVFPGIWPWLSAMIALYGVLMIHFAWQRTRFTVDNLLLRNDKQFLLERQEAETERANRANQEKSAFLAAASHDLRQPLHALMLTAHALHLRAPEGESRQLAQRVLDAGQALSEQFNHLMDLSRLESGSYRAHPSLTPLPALLDQVVSTQHQFAEHRQVALHCRLSWRLRQQGVLLDPGLLRRVLDNLVHNAIKFSNEGGRVLLTARMARGVLVLAVHDRGIGIAPEHSENIFKPYVQLNNPTRDMRRGIGLGLSIVRQAAVLLGGQLAVESKTGFGSCFRLELPASLLHKLPALAETRGEPTALPVERLRGKRLLIVEDDPMAGAALRTWAEGWDLQVLLHGDPREVREDAQPDLILSDIRLPGERDGIAWTVEWLGWWPEARSLLLSGEISPEVHQRAEQEGLILLAKPVQPDFLLQTLVGMTS